MNRAPKDRPYILLNMSMSADGKIASAQQGINHFSSPRDHDHLYELRATVDAVINGARTVDTAKIEMDPGPTKYRRQRIRNGLREYNHRIIVSGTGSLSSEAEVFNHRFSPILVITSGRCSQRNLKRLQSLADDVIVSGWEAIDFKAVMQMLKRQWKIKRLLCEGGGALNDALFCANLIDEIHLTLCPLIIGGRRAPTISDGLGSEHLADARKFTLTKRKQIGDELYLTYHRKR